jgi:hypothetical protein
VDRTNRRRSALKAHDARNFGYSGGVVQRRLKEIFVWLHFRQEPRRRILRWHRRQGEKITLSKLQGTPHRRVVLPFAFTGG